MGLWKKADESSRMWYANPFKDTGVYFEVEKRGCLLMLYRAGFVQWTFEQVLKEKSPK